MIFGIDFDNTIVNYDKIFKNILKKKIKYKKKNLNDKDSIKKYLIKKNMISKWKSIQSDVYSNYIEYATPNKEIIKLLKYLDKKKINFYIISHKTLYPYVGKKKNLHKISKNWIKINVFNKKNNFKKKYKYYFENTEFKKIKRIKNLRITHFVDDLKKILNKLPNYIVPIHFDKKFNFKNFKKKLII